MTARRRAWPMKTLAVTSMHTRCTVSDVTDQQWRLAVRSRYRVTESEREALNL
jgi:hypothetical protein